MDGPPEFTNWQEAWEWHAMQTHRAYEEESLADLLRQIEARQYDGYYVIWDSIRQKGTLAECAPTLLEVLRRETDEHSDLIRYHCAGALFHLLGYPDDPIQPLRARVQWAHEGEEARQTAVAELAALIQTRLSGGSLP